jgi:2-amino-4-hydroxy-6-hydroxymethyldihydropteridine diphosphokinase
VESRSRAFVGVGSNLGDREAVIRGALELLAKEPGVDVVRVSSLRETEPVGYTAQPHFLNGVAEVRTTLGPRELLSALLRIEAALGRERRGPQFGPRTIDLDLLLVDDLVVDEPGLTVPHPRLHERRFALEPLAELDPGLVVPGHGPVTALLAEVDGARLAG